MENFNFCVGTRNFIWKRTDFQSSFGKNARKKSIDCNGGKQYFNCNLAICCFWIIEAVQFKLLGFLSYNFLKIIHHIKPRTAGGLYI